MNTKRKTLKMPVRYLMNAVLVALLFVGLSFLTAERAVHLPEQGASHRGHQHHSGCLAERCHRLSGPAAAGPRRFHGRGCLPCALFTKYSNLPSGVAFVVGLVLACIVAGLFGVLIGIPALRLTGDYLAILTLGFGEIIRITLNNIDDVAGLQSCSTVPRA